jgi:hypothetical protein
MSPRASRIGLACLALLLCDLAGAQAVRLGAYATVDAQAWSNGLPVLAIDGDWSRGYTPRSGPQAAYVSGRVEAGAQFAWAARGSEPEAVSAQALASAWRMGLLARADATAKASGDAAQVLYHYQSRTDPSAPAVYNADTDLQIWSGRGVALHTPGWQLGPITLDAGWDHLVLQRLRTLQTRGQVAYTAQGSYAYQGQLRDDDNKASTLFMAPAAAQGVGDALSLGLSWRLGESGHRALAPWMPDLVQVQLQDLWSSLRWAGVNGNDALLDSEVSVRTPDGYTAYRAAIQGQYTRRTVHSRIPMTTQVQLNWAGDGQTWSWRMRERLGLLQNWLGWQSQGAVGWRVAIEPVAGAAQVGVDWRGLSLSYLTDRLDAGGHARGVQLSWSTPGF